MNTTYYYGFTWVYYQNSNIRWYLYSNLKYINEISKKFYSSNCQIKITYCEVAQLYSRLVGVIIY